MDIESSLEACSHLKHIYGSGGEEKLSEASILVLGQTSETKDHTLDFYEHFLTELKVKSVHLEHATRDWAATRQPSQTNLVVIPTSPSNGEARISQSDLVVFIEDNVEKATALNEACRQASVPFIWALAPAGNPGTLSLFVDPGQDHVLLNPEGFCRQDSQAVSVGHATKTNPPLITCNIVHELQTGQVVTICDEDYLVEIVSDREFHARPVKAEQADTKRRRTGVSGEIKLSVQLKEPDLPWAHSDLESQLWNPALPSSDAHTRKDHLRFLQGIFKTLSRADLLAQISDPTMKALLEAMPSQLGESQQEVSPCALWGILASLTAHQVANLISRRFPPLQQWCHFSPDPEMAVSTGVCQPMKVAICGLGQMGISLFGSLLSSCQPFISKLILCGDQIIDTDLLANCSDFLEGDVYGKPVSSVLLGLAKRRKVSFPVVAYPSLTNDNLEHFPSNCLASEVDVFLSCEESWDHRGYLGDLAIRHSKIMIDVGTSKLAGHVESVVPHRTESHASIPDPLESSVPFCVLKSFPQNPDHGIDWAGTKLESLLKDKPKVFNEFWTANGSNLDELLEGTLPQESPLVKKILEQWRCSTWAECLGFARNKFEKYFNHKAQQLLQNFPQDAKTSAGEAFWAYPKQLPRPIAFDTTNRVHLKFVMELAQIWAGIMNIRDQISMDETEAEKIVTMITIQSFVSERKSIVTDETLSKEDAISSESSVDIFSNVSERKLFVDLLKQSQLRSLSLETWSVTDWNSLLTLCAQMRCEMYGIGPPNAREVQRKFYKTCFCVPHIVSTLANLTCLELSRLSASKKDDGTLEANFVPMNHWINGTLSEIISAPSPAVKVVSSSTGKNSFSLWTQLKIQGSTNWTVQDFLTYLLKEHDLDVTMLVQGFKMIYVAALPMHAMRKSKPLSKFLKPEPDYVSLSTTIKSPHGGDEVEGPQMRFKYI